MLFPDTYVEVILPLGIPNKYTYAVPSNWTESVGIGKRVVVQFGKSKLYTAIIAAVNSSPPKGYQAKPIQEVLDQNAIVTPNQLALWEWISDYYMCHIGDVMSAALPSGLKLTSETKLLLNEEAQYDLSHLTDEEFLIVEALQINTVLTLDEVSKILGKKTIYPTIKILLQREVIVVQEQIKNKFVAKKEKFVSLQPKYFHEANMRALFDELGRAPKQLNVVMKFMELTRMFAETEKQVKQKVLLTESNATTAQLKALLEKGVFNVEEVVVGRIGPSGDDANKEVTLNKHQERALVEINSGFKEKNAVLLHGVTSSGKTELYVKLIEQVIAQGKQVLYLLPEIALTTQIINRLKKYFGDDIGVYHSKFNQNERVEIWSKQLGATPYKIVLGARSSVFLPFQDLGLIVIDEEHDASFKQFEPSPRYNARDTAMVLAHMYQAKVILGSATPSLESMHNAETGKFGLVSLLHRHGGVQMPKIEIVDLATAHKKKKMQGHFSHALIHQIDEALVNKEQVILFQNRRGFAPYIICQTCGWTPYCKRCDVGLTYHKYLHRLKCHYCGFEQFMPKKCDACGSHEVQLSGFGTEKIEEDIQLMFPNATVARMDLETTRSKNAYHNIITDFEEKRIDILVGTQMVTKGLDFENVSLVGVLNADQSLNFQDFRAHERSYQLLSQVSGRAGRSKKQGLVLVQSFDPKHPILAQVITSDYLGMYAREMQMRREFLYPPYHKLIKVVLKHVSKERVVEGGIEMGNMLKANFGNRVLGPEFPGIPRVRNKYINHLFIKVENKASIAKAKQRLVSCIDNFKMRQEYRSIQVIIDVDPA